jgi:lantibiotic modifying enzyme
MQTTAIYDENEHEPLIDAGFDESAARDFIVDIIHTADTNFQPGRGWPLHPEDQYGEETTPALGLYCGAAGTVWALARLAERYGISLTHDYAQAIRQFEERMRGSTDPVPSYCMGTSGLAFVHYLLTHDDDSLHRAISDARANGCNPAREFLWGSPGTAIPALLMREYNGEHRFDELISEVQDELWRTWEPDTLLWLQDMYGRQQRYVGAGHGAATNVSIFLRAYDVVRTERKSDLLARIRSLFERYAIKDGRAMNWFSLGTPSGNRMQWCHGAPGVIIGLSAFAEDDVLDPMLLKAGNAIWQAGPLKKGPTLCHGTAGNGFALLRLSERTGDRTWLERARRFAAHAMQQVAQWRETFGMASASLWTGEPGVALYIDAVLRRDCRILSLDAV